MAFTITQTPRLLAFTPAITTLFAVAEKNQKLKTDSPEISKFEYRAIINNKITGAQPKDIYQLILKFFPNYCPPISTFLLGRTAIEDEEHSGPSVRDPHTI